EGGQQPPPVPEVVAERGVAHLSCPRQRTDAEPVDPTGLDGLGGRREHRAAQVSVVVAHGGYLTAGNFTAPPVVFPVDRWVATGPRRTSGASGDVPSTALHGGEWIMVNAQVLSAEVAQTGGIVLLTVVAIAYGGTFLLRVVRGSVPTNDLQKSFFRAGHAHAGVLVILGLVAGLYV